MPTPHPVPIEKPDHVDDARMRHISDPDLYAALDLARPGLAAVKAAVEHQDWPAANAAWATYFAQRSTPLGVVNPNNYLTLSADLREQRGAPVIAAARELAAKKIGFTAEHHERTPLYGFHYFLWMRPLFQAYDLDRDPAHGAAFVRIFNQWYAERDLVHGDIESLNVIWYTLGLSIRSLNLADGCYAFRHLPVFDADTQNRLLKTFLGAARWLAEEHDRYRPGNWQITAAATLFELGVCFPEFREAADWRDLGWTLLLGHLELDVDTDGGHGERSPSYHRHVLSCLSRAASVAELNGYPPMQAVPRFGQMYRWLLEHTTPMACATNANDSHIIWPGGWAMPGLILFEDPHLKWLVEQVATPDDVAWALAALPDRPSGRTAMQVYASIESRAPDFGSVLQSASKFALMRSGLGPDDLFMCVNYGPLAGHEYESHSHRDALSFTCFGYGAPLAIEAGLSLTSYDDPLYQGWIRTAAAHNMLLVDESEPSESMKEGDLTFWSSTAVADRFEARHWGYFPLGLTVDRSILFVKGEYWIVADTVPAHRDPHRLDWLLYMPQPFTLENNRVRPTAGPGLAVLPVLPAKGGRLEPRKGFMAIPTPRAFDAVSPFRDVNGLSHTLQTTGESVTFLHVLYPVRSPEQATALRAEPVSVGGTALACRITTLVQPDYFYFGTGAPFRFGNWFGGARVAWLRAPDHWAVYGGASLMHAGVPIMGASFPPETLTLAPSAQGWRGEATITRQTRLSLNLQGAGPDVKVNGVLAQTLRLDPPGPGPYPLAEFPGHHLLLPSPGRYVIELTRAA